MEWTMDGVRVVLAATGSGSGKTMITCSLLRALSKRGKKVQAFKCGPDYIDPMFHEKVLGVPSRNLDLYFTGEEETRALFALDNHADISVIEGVMGLYDGLGGICEDASAYHLAKVLKAPILLIVDAHGMGLSVLAQIAGFLSMDKEHLIKGILLNKTSEDFYRNIAPLIESELSIKVYGHFPQEKDLQLDSRYLGLKLPGEIEDLQERCDRAAQVLEKSFRLDEFLEMAAAEGKAHPLKIQTPVWMNPLLEKGSAQTCASVGQAEKPVRIGVARDEAFCFYYRDNLRMLEAAGAELVPFSPLRDQKLPDDLDGLLLGGGYPELKAAQLSANTGMCTTVREAILAGMPSLAECGGFMYLHDWIQVKKKEEGNAAESLESYSMAGVLHGNCFDTGRLVRFGYAEFKEKNTGLVIRGHEFHYFDSSCCGTDCIAVKPVTGRSWECMATGENHFWGFGHLYYPSAPEFVEWFVGACRKWRDGGRNGQQEA